MITDSQTEQLTEQMHDLTIEGFDLPSELNITNDFVPLDTQETNNSLLNAIAKLKYSANLEQQEDFIVQQGLALYIPSYAADYEQVEDVPEEEQHLLIDRYYSFAADAKQEIWLLQGNSGYGKSLFGRYLEKHLWSSYQEGELIPIFIELPKIDDLTRVSDLISKALEIKGIQPDNITKLKLYKKFLFILDGYDEIPDKLKLLQQYNFNHEGGWQGKILISCSTQHLTTEEEQFLYIKYSNEPLYQAKERFIKSYILPFSKQQINQYITSFSASQFNKTANWDLEIYQSKIAKFEELTKFLKEPFLLFLILNVLPDLSKTNNQDKIKKIDLYNAFINKWFNSQYERITQHASIFSYSKEDILTTFDQYAKNLAFQMFLGNNQVIKQLDNSQVTALIDFQGSLLKRIGESYSFINRSFQEYFVAKKIIDELAINQFSGLQQKLITELAILDFIASKASPTRLLTVTLNSQKHPELSISSANAITILNIANFSFSGLDLNSISVPYANLSQGIFDTTNFENANLAGVSFKGSYLRNCNFKNAQMSKVEFGEQAYLDKYTKVCVCSYDYLVLAQGFSIELYDKSLNLLHAFKSTDWVNVVAISPNQQLLAAAVDGDNNKLALYETATYELLTILTDSKGTICSFAFSADSKLLASGHANGHIYLWDTASYELKATFNEHSFMVNSLAFLNNSCLISGSDDKTVRLWSIIEFKLKKTLKLSRSIKAVSVSSDCQTIAAGGLDKTIYLWNPTDYQLKNIITHIAAINSLAFNPASPQELAVGSKNHPIHFFKTTSGKLITTFERGIAGVNSISFKPDGKELISANVDNTLHVWSVQPLLKKSIYKQREAIKKLEITLNPINIIAKSAKRLSIWDINGQLITTRSCQSPIVAETVSNLQLTANSKFNIIYLYNAQNQLQQTFKGHNKAIIGISFSPNNEFLASSSLDRTIKIWNITNSKNIITLKTSNIITSILWLRTSQGLSLITGSDQGDISFFKFINNDLQLSWTTCQTILNIEKTIITKAQGLSNSNINLLNKGGAVGSPIITIADFESSLHIAAANGNLSKLQKLLNNNNINQPDSCKRTPLYWAAVNGHFEVLNTLIASGAAIDAPDNKGVTPLYIAAEKNHLEVVNALIAAGAAINGPDSDGYTPLIIAAEKGHLEIVNALIAAGAAINWPTNDGWTPLNTASGEGHLEVVAALIVSGAAIDEPDNDGWTPLYISAQQGHIEVVTTLITAGATINTPTNDGWTPLNTAADEGHLEVVTALIASGAAIDEPDNNGWTPLNISAQRGHIEIVNALIEVGASINKPNNYGWTPLYNAAQQGNIEIVAALIASGAFIDEPDNNGWTPLNVAAQQGHIEVVTALIAAGAAINEPTNDGWTPLYNATQQGHLEVATALIASGAVIEEPDNTLFGRPFI